MHHMAEIPLGISINSIVKSPEEEEEVATTINPQRHLTFREGPDRSLAFPRSLNRSAIKWQKPTSINGKHSLSRPG
jgi:hypothetical protein